MSKTNISIEAIIKYAVEKAASDIHLSVGRHVIYRIQGKLHVIDQNPILTQEDLESLRDQMISKYPKYLDELANLGETDFGYIAQDDTSFRVNGFYRLEKLSFSMRRIEKDAMPIEKLGAPSGIYKFTEAKQGMVLVTGPTGSGKSTTLVSMLEEINQKRAEHIVTIEDPIEFIFEDKKSFFSQREIGKDTKSFISAIRAAMREDPDIVMVGEMRDAETVEAAMNLAETGHLVFSTLHTSGSVATINRLIQFFPPEAQHQVQARIADSLLGVLSQRLLKRRDKNARIAMHELMNITPGIQNLIRAGDLAQINNAIELGRTQGMLPMKVSAQMLEKKGYIKKEDYMGFFTRDAF